MIDVLIAIDFFISLSQTSWPMVVLTVKSLIKIISLCIVCWCIMVTPLNIKLVLMLIICVYLFGSISTAILLCKLFNLPDPRAQGSKNPGTTNVLRIAGKKLAFSVLLLDVLKGCAVVWFARLLAMPNLVVAIMALAVFLGQLFPVFFSFRGGKGVAITLGIISALYWPLSLFCLITWVVTFMVFRISSLAAISAVVVAILISILSLHIKTNLYLPTEFAICIIFLGGLILLKHKQNIQNLFNHTEGKI